ncbi:MAG: effector-associated domain EAD1-containing protein [Phormidesmis sp.]
MSITWDRHKRKAFKSALHQVYPDYNQLDLFVYDAIDENLADITNDTRVEISIRYLLRWADGREGVLDELFEAFCEENPNNSNIAIIEGKSITAVSTGSHPSKIAQQDWDRLFQSFNEGDKLELSRAFKVVSKLLVNPKFQTSIRSLEPFEAVPQSVLTIRERLEKWDSPELSFCFACEALEQLRLSDSEGVRDLTPIAQWKDWISKTYQLADITDVEPVTAGYLIVSVQETGRRRQQVKDVMLYPELHILQQPSEQPSEQSPEQVLSAVDGENGEALFQLNQQTMTPVKCPLSEIGKALSKLLHKAEDKLLPYCERVTLELFLRWPQIEEDAANWDGEDRDQNDFKFKYQRYLIRSLDRFLKAKRNKALMPMLERNWQALEASVSRQLPYEKFHHHKTCPESGQLKALLSQKTGLTLAALLPEDEKARKAVFNNIIESAVPVAIWTANASCSSQQMLEKLEKGVLVGACLTNFDSVAECWMQSRAQQLDDELVGGLRVLFDCPTRWPTSLPNTASDAAAQPAKASEIIAADDDLIVAP